MNHVDDQVDVQSNFGPGLPRVFIELQEGDVRAELDKHPDVQVVSLVIRRADGTEARFSLRLQGTRPGQNPALRAELYSQRKPASDDTTTDVRRTALAYFRHYGDGTS
jgi:hypothetical protein